MNRQNVSTSWKKTRLSIGLVLILSVVIFYDSWFSIVNIWYRSTTFTHGFLIIPISLWLIWTKRDFFSTLEPRIDWKITGFVFLSGFLWLLADLSNIQVIKQFATVSLLISSLWLVLGTKVAIQMFFPLFFLFFMVPVGEGLISPLMEFTATFTVGLIRLSGMSVFREGLHFSLTSGNWSVVEACSGISYLIASVTLGVVYAYLTYHSFWKRCIFVLFSIIVPIFANGLRAYLIVMIGHYSNMTLAVGVDHLIYGGVFFGLVMMVLFYIGSFWRDPIITVPDRGIVNNRAEKDDLNPILLQIGRLFIIIALSYSIWPLTSHWLSSQQDNVLALQTINVEDSRWGKTVADWQWKPAFNGVKNDTLDYFSDNDDIVAVYRASFGKESQGSGELVNSQNLIISAEDENWKIISTGSRDISDLFELDETILSGKNSDLLTLSWYRVGNVNTSNKYRAKILQLLKRLKADTAPEYLIVVAIETPQQQHGLARKKLTRFVEKWVRQ